MTETEAIIDFGRSLEFMMQERRMTRQELAIESGVSEATISRCINGKFLPNLRTIVNLSYALSCDISELIGAYEKIR